jgi:DNA-binding NarL/FixJ family response regulator
VAALSIVRRLVDGAVNLAERPDAVIAQLWYLRGRTYSALRRFDEAAADLEAAAIRADAEGRPGLLWRIRAERARVYRAQGRILDAARERDAARQLIETLSAEFSTAAQQSEDAARLAGQFVERAIAALPDDAPAAAPGGLKAREREVAALVAQGKTNREIAEMLVLSERTAERHVANIMARLNFNTRAQIAAWAVQAGLTQG